MEKIEAEINKVNVKIDEIEETIKSIEGLLKKKFELWTEEEKEEYGNKELLRKEKVQLRKKEAELAKQKTQLEKQKTQLEKQKAELRTKEAELEKQNTLILEKSIRQGTGMMDIDVPPFDPSNFQIPFPFFEPNGESYLTLLARDEIVKDINQIVLPNPNTRKMRRQKYWPIVISTSRGMGKTFLLKMVGLQRVKPELKNVLIEEAGSCGRILSFDFVKEPTAIQSTADIEIFFPRLMIYYLCFLFDGTQVDGIHFEKISLISMIVSHNGRQERFNLWKKKWAFSRTDEMIDEYIRLTNIAFGVDDKSECFHTPPVFLLDEIQRLCGSTEVESTFTKDGRKMHTRLSLLLTKLAGKHQPICICTGTNNGEIISITEMSAIVPQVLYLTPLVEEKDYKQFWTEMTNHYNEGNPNPVRMEGDADLISCLVYSSYQIPRLLLIAHQAWYTTRQTVRKDRENLIQNYEADAIKYYKEMATVLTNFTVQDLSHIVLSCSVHWTANDESYVPGTKIKWSFLIENSLIFPYVESCYLFPFTLVWREDPRTSTKTKEELNRIKQQVEEYCHKKVKNLNIRNMFLSFDDICRFDLYNLGICYENLFVSSLAVKYYLWKLLQSPDNAFALFSDIYDFGAENDTAEKILGKFRLNLSEGIFYPMKEAYADQNLPMAVIHNRPNHNAHHDILLPTNLGYIAVSAKASFNYGSRKIEEQWYVSKTSNQRVVQLIWLYLGNLEKEKNQLDVAFLNGSGVCNGLAFDQFGLVKKLKKQNNEL